MPTINPKGIGNSIMANLFDLIKVYESEWQEVSARNFTEQEQLATGRVEVVASKYGKSVCFHLAKGKAYIPLEPNSEAKVDDLLDIETIKIVDLKYVGNKADQQGKHILRIRTKEAKPKAEISFDNPFGL